MPCGDLPVQNKLVLVTGGGSGINYAFVKLVVDNGAKGVIVADLGLNEESEAYIAGTPNVFFSKCDVRVRKDLEDAVQLSSNKFGDVPDIYIAGAGVFTPKWSNWWDDTEQDRYAELDINTTGALKLARIATKALVNHGKKGVILITASLAGYMGTLACPLYCASKHAVIGFVRSMAQVDEFENIKVVAVAPGLVRTPLWLDHPELQKQFGYDDQFAVSPESVADTMLKLATSGKYGGGTCLEIAKSGVRSLGVWNIDPPAGAGVSVPKEFLQQQWDPIKVILDKQRIQKL